MWVLQLTSIKAHLIIGPFLPQNWQSERSSQSTEIPNITPCKAPWMLPSQALYYPSEWTHHPLRLCKGPGGFESSVKLQGEIHFLKVLCMPLTPKLLLHCLLVVCGRCLLLEYLFIVSAVLTGVRCVLSCVAQCKVHQWISILKTKPYLCLK